MVVETSVDVVDGIVVVLVCCCWPRDSFCGTIVATVDDSIAGKSVEFVNLRTTLESVTSFIASTSDTVIILELATGAAVVELDSLPLEFVVVEAAAVFGVVVVVVGVVVVSAAVVGFVGIVVLVVVVVVG